jgi:hypothetical protein
MALLKKNIWMLFTVLLLSGVVLLIVLSVSRWQGMHRHFAENQSALAQNWYGSFSSLLDQQESIITLLGRKLLLDQRKGNEDVREELDAIMALNPEIFAGFALSGRGWL